MRLQFKLASIVVPRGQGLVVVGFDMGEGYYGVLPMSPEQAQQFASDIPGDCCRFCSAIISTVAAECAQRRPGRMFHPVESGATMPQVLKSAKNGQIEVKYFYTAGDIAHLMRVSHATALRLIDSGEMPGIRLLTGSRPRRITHKALIAFVRRNPDFKYMLERLKGYDPSGDFPEGDEPLPPARPMGHAAPWGPEHPRTAYRGQIPRAESYSTREIAFILGLSRRTVVTKFGSRVLPGVRVPATRSGLTTWKWKIMHGPLVAFLRRNPRYFYALDRIQGCESSSAAGASRAGEANGSCRKEPIIAPGDPGWRGRPHQTRRGGFKRGPKLPDGRQPSKTSADVDADSRADRG